MTIDQYLIDTSPQDNLGIDSPHSTRNSDYTSHYCTVYRHCSEARFGNAHSHNFCNCVGCFGLGTVLLDKCHKMFAHFDFDIGLYCNLYSYLVLSGLGIALLRN